MNHLGNYTCSSLAEIVRNTPGAAYLKVWKGQSALTSILTLGITSSQVHGYWIYDKDGKCLKQDHQSDMKQYKQNGSNDYIWIGHHGGNGVRNPACFSLPTA